MVTPGPDRFDAVRRLAATVLAVVCAATLGLAVVALVALLGACAGTAAKAADCAAFLDVMRAGKASGLPCTEYVARARAAEPACHVGELRCPEQP